MFFVYGIGGRVFRGSTEQLRQIGGVNAIARTRAIQATGRDGSDPDSRSADTAFPVDAPSAPVDQNHRSALAAYAETQKVEHLPQPLRRVDELMSRAVTTLPDSATVLEAWHTLADKKLGQAPGRQRGRHFGWLAVPCRLDATRSACPTLTATPWCGTPCWRKT